MNAGLARLVTTHAPRATAIADQLPAVGANLQRALAGLGSDPSHARAGMVALQLGGALGLVRKLQEALARAASEADAAR